jgi:cysteine-rich repeat protein
MGEAIVNESPVRTPAGWFRSLSAAVSLLMVLLVLSLGDAWAAKPFCGDGQCKGSETPVSCPDDCGEPEPDVCGDGQCTGTETPESCPSDCEDPEPPPPGSCNNDGVCNAGEDCLSCGDCSGKTGGNPKNRFCCGQDGYCNADRCGASCGAAVPVCGNGLTEYDEECDDGNLVPGDGCNAFCETEAPLSLVPLNQFNIGDSIGEGEAADGTIGEPHHESVWSTGYAGGDGVNSLNERFEARDAAAYVENDAGRDIYINQAVSGAVMADFESQALAVEAEMAAVPPGTAGMVSILLGNNDVCASSIGSMTDPAVFEAQYRAGLDVLADSPFSADVNLLISGVPAIYWLWEAKRSDLYCRLIAWPFVPCENLLDNAADDCVSTASREDPDQVYDGDGPNCQRRKAFHARIRDEYNPILSGVLDDYQAQGKLLNAEYVDILDIRFDSQHVNGGDCFHPSRAGHALMAERQWCRSKWGVNDPACSP